MGSPRVLGPLCAGREWATLSGLRERTIKNELLALAHSCDLRIVVGSVNSWRSLRRFRRPTNVRCWTVSAYFIPNTISSPRRLLDIIASF